jgi:hypothetical protein
MVAGVRVADPALRCPSLTCVAGYLINGGMHPDRPAIGGDAGTGVFTRGNDAREY